MIKEGTPACGICAPEDYYHRITQNRIAQECAEPQQQWIYKLIDLSEGRFSDLHEEILINEKKWFMCYNVNATQNKHCISMPYEQVEKVEQVEQHQQHEGNEQSENNENVKKIQEPENAVSEPELENKNQITQTDCVLITSETAETRTRYLVIFKDTNLKTLRDLRSHHVPMLIDMQGKIRQFLKQQYGARQKHYNIFFHYMPSVFQLHAHVSPRRVNSNSVRRQPVNVVTRNLLANSSHYQTCLMYTLIYIPQTRHWREGRNDGRNDIRSDTREVCERREAKEGSVMEEREEKKQVKRVYSKKGNCPLRKEIPP